MITHWLNDDPTWQLRLIIIIIIYILQKLEVFALLIIGIIKLPSYDYDWQNCQIMKIPVETKNRLDWLKIVLILSNQEDQLLDNKSGTELNNKQLMTKLDKFINHVTDWYKFEIASPSFYYGSINHSLTRLRWWWAIGVFLRQSGYWWIFVKHWL